MKGEFGSSKFKSTYMLMLAFEVSKSFKEFQDNVEQLNLYAMQKLQYFDEEIRIKFLEDYKTGLRLYDILIAYFGGHDSEKM